MNYQHEKRRSKTEPVRVNAVKQQQVACLTPNKLYDIYYQSLGGNGYGNSGYAQEFAGKTQSDARADGATHDGV